MSQYNQSNLVFVAEALTRFVAHNKHVERKSRVVLLNEIGEFLKDFSDTPWVDPEDAADLLDVAEYALGCAWKLTKDKD